MSSKKTITPEILDKMIEMRTQGATYPEIMNALGVTKERCMAYLKNIPIQFSAMEVNWRVAENEAVDILTHMGFSHIVNLNEVCNIAPYWDYYTELENNKWLIDVTINGQKSISAKQERCVDGYNHAILLKTDKEWILKEIIINSKMSCPII